MLDKAVQDHLGRHLRTLYAGAKERDRNRLATAAAVRAPEDQAKKAGSTA